MIGVLGGTFAPIHNGHLRLAIEARDQLGLSEVKLIPAASPPLRAQPAVPARRRLEWAQLAVAGEKGLSVDGRELARSGPSYTVDTLAELRAEHPRARLFLLLGADAASRIGQWHRWQELPALAQLVVCNRPGADAGPQAGLFLRLTMPALEISATDIRRRIKAGHSLRGLVPDRVLDSFTSQDHQALSQDAQ